jgi:hypothetical protein
MAVPALTANSPSAGYIAWTAFTIQYGGVAYSVGASNTNATYTAWLYNGGSPLLAVSNNAPVMSSTVNGTAADWAGTTPVLGSDDLLLFVNRSGVPINVQAAQLIDGDMILTGTLTSANIATGGIVSNSLYTGAVQANLIQAGNIATDTITANQIAANAIGTTELSASAVIADKIAAGAITAEKLTIGSLGDNMVKNSGMEDASQANAALPANWTSAYESIGAPTFLWQASISGNKSIGITNSTANGGAWGSDSFPVTAGQTLALSVLAKASATTGSNVYVRIFYGTNQAMTRITTTPAAATNVQWLNTGTGVVTNATGGASTAYAQLVGGFIIPTTSTIQISGASVVPATATWAQVAVYNWTGTAASTVYFDEVNVNEVILSARIANGSITANNIQANTINTGQLNANAINGMTITSNTINSAIINSTTINTSTINGATFTISGQTSSNLYMSANGGDAILFRAGNAVTPTGTTISSGNAYIASESTLNGGTDPGLILYSGDTAGTTLTQGSGIYIYPADITLANAYYSRSGRPIRLIGDVSVMAANGWSGAMIIDGAISAPTMRFQASRVATLETTTSGTYAALATAQSVSLVVPTSGAVKISMTAQMSNSGVNGICLASVQVVDNTTSTTVYAAQDNDCIALTSATAGAVATVSRVFAIGLPTLNIGHTITVSMLYRVGSGTGSFSRRELFVEPLI